MGNITRHQCREQAFIILFEKTFSDMTIDEIIENAGVAREFQPSDFALELINGVEDKAQELDKIIEKFLKGWKINRLSKVILTLLRLSIYEMLYIKDIPLSVSINEAVKFGKEYSTEKETAFLNGVLGSITRSSYVPEEKKKI